MLTYCISLNAQDLETGADDPFPFPDARSSHCSIYCLLRAPTNPKPNMYIHICGPAPLSVRCRTMVMTPHWLGVMQLKHTMLVGAVLKWFAAAIQIQTFSSVENAIV